MENKNDIKVWVYEEEGGRRWLYYEKDGKCFEEYQEYYAALGWKTIMHPVQIPVEDFEEIMEVAI